MPRKIDDKKELIKKVGKIQTFTKKKVLFRYRRNKGDSSAKLDGNYLLICHNKALNVWIIYMKTQIR